MTDSKLVTPFIFSHAAGCKYLPRLKAYFKVSVFIRCSLANGSCLIPVTCQDTFIPDVPPAMRKVFSLISSAMCRLGPVHIAYLTDACGGS